MGVFCGFRLDGRWQLVDQLTVEFLEDESAGVLRRVELVAVGDYPPDI